MNAQNVDTLLELASAFDAADNDDRVRVVILTGIESFIGKRPPAFPMKISKDMPAFYPWWQEREFKYY